MTFSRLVQVSNLSTLCTKDQLTTLFSYVGPLEESVIYPEGDTLTSTVGTKVGYVRFTRSESARIAIHLTNIIFIEKQLIVAYVLDGRIPDEADAIKYCAPLNPNITLIAGGPSWNSTIINRVVGQGINAEIETMDHELNERNLPMYPNLSGSLDHLKAEEIRRTVYISNIDSTVTLEMLEEFISQIGEVRFIRSAYEKENDETKDAYVEFTEQHSVPRALCLNGFFFISRPIEVNHALKGVSKSTSLTAPAPEILATSHRSRSISLKRSFHSRSRSPIRKLSSPRRQCPSTSVERRRRLERSPSFLRQRSPSYHRRNQYYSGSRMRSPRFVDHRRGHYGSSRRPDRSPASPRYSHRSSHRSPSHSRRHRSRSNGRRDYKSPDPYRKSISRRKSKSRSKRSVSRKRSIESRYRHSNSRKLEKSQSRRRSVSKNKRSRENSSKVQDIAGTRRSLSRDGLINKPKKAKDTKDTRLEENGDLWVAADDMPKNNNRERKSSSRKHRSRERSSHNNEKLHSKLRSRDRRSNSSRKKSNIKHDSKRDRQRKSRSNSMMSRSSCD